MVVRWGLVHWPIRDNINTHLRTGVNVYPGISYIRKHTVQLFPDTNLNTIKNTKTARLCV